MEQADAFSDLEVAYARECALSSTLAHTVALLSAVDDHDLPERPSLIAKAVLRLSYAVGQTSVRIERQEDLGELTGIDKTKIAPALAVLTKDGILQIHEGTKIYEILPNVSLWKRRARCRRGHDHALALAVEITQADQRRRSAQRDFGDHEESFVPEPTLLQIKGELARGMVSPPEGQSSLIINHASSRPGADEEKQSPNPPGPIGIEKPAGSLSLAERTRQVIESGGTKVAQKATSAPTQPSISQPKVAQKATLGATEPPDPGRKLPFRQLSSRARASDDPVIPHHPVSPSQRLSSDDPDECRGTEGKGMMVGLDHSLLGDIERKIGPLGNHAWFWREAIAACLPAAVHALAVVKYAQRDNPGGYMRTSFYNEADRLGVKLTLNLENRRPQRRAQDKRRGKGVKR